MKELLGAFSYLGIHQFVSLVFGMVRSKIIASLLGPFGMGIFSQANNFMELVRQVSSLGIGDGFLKLVSDFRNHQDGKRLGKTIITAVSVFGSLGILLSLFSGLFSSTVSRWIFDDPGYGWFVFIVAITGLLSAEYFTFLYIYQALLKWAEYAFVSVVGYVLNIFISIVLIFLLQIWGAILSMLIAQLINIIIVVFVLRRKVLPQEFKLIVRQRPDLLCLKELTRYIGSLSTITVVATLSTIMIRSRMVHVLGVDANGIYQVVYAISLAYMGLIRNAFTAFGMPKVTESLESPAKIVRVQNDEMRLGLLILSPLTLFIMITRVIWIPILYSSDFLSAAPLLIWQFLADIVRMIRVSMNISLLPLDRFRFILVDGLVDWLGWATLSLILIPSMGIAAVPFSYMVVGLVSLLIAIAYHKKTTPYRMYKPNRSLLGKVFVLLLPGLFLAQWGVGLLLQVIIPLILLFVMIVWMPSREEYSDLFRLVREQTRRVRQKK